MSQPDAGNAQPPASNRPGGARAETKGPATPESPGLGAGLLGSAGRIAAYAGATAVIGVIAVVIALLASGILAI